MKLATLAMTFGVMGLAGGCDGMMPEPIAPAAMDEEPLAPEPTWRYGVVSWQGLVTDCPDEAAWVEDEVGMALVEGDRVTLMFETMPALTGTIEGGRAAVSGRMTFPGETGAEVTCVVAGSTALTESALEGEMHEALSSVGDVNCESRARYRMVFDP